MATILSSTMKLLRALVRQRHHEYECHICMLLFALVIVTRLCRIDETAIFHVTFFHCCNLSSPRLVIRHMSVIPVLIIDYLLIIFIFISL